MEFRKDQLKRLISYIPEDFLNKRYDDGTIYLLIKIIFVNLDEDLATRLSESFDLGKLGNRVFNRLFLEAFGIKFYDIRKRESWNMTKSLMFMFNNREEYKHRYNNKEEDDNLFIHHIL